MRAFGLFGVFILSIFGRNNFHSNHPTANDHEGGSKFGGNGVHRVLGTTSVHRQNALVRKSRTQDGHM